MMRIFAVAALALGGVALLAPRPAFADAATHKFRIVKAATSERADCGSSGCTTACQVYATLENLTGGTDESISVTLYFPHPALNRDEGQSGRLSFWFPKMERKQVEKTTDHVLGMRCSQITVQNVEIACDNDRPFGSCGFVNVDIAPDKRLGLKARRVSN